MDSKRNNSGTSNYTKRNKTKSNKTDSNQAPRKPKPADNIIEPALHQALVISTAQVSSSSNSRFSPSAEQVTKLNNILFGLPKGTPIKEFDRVIREIFPQLPDNYFEKGQPGNGYNAYLQHNRVAPLYNITEPALRDVMLNYALTQKGSNFRPTEKQVEDLNKLLPTLDKLDFDKFYDGISKIFKSIPIEKIELLPAFQGRYRIAPLYGILDSTLQSALLDYANHKQTFKPSEQLVDVLNHYSEVLVEQLKNNKAELLKKIATIPAKELKQQFKALHDEKGHADLEAIRGAEGKKEESEHNDQAPEERKESGPQEDPTRSQLINEESGKKSEGTTSTDSEAEKNQGTTDSEEEDDGLSIAQLEAAISEDEAKLRREEALELAIVGLEASIQEIELAIEIPNEGETPDEDVDLDNLEKAENYKNLVKQLKANKEVVLAKIAEAEQLEPDSFNPLQYIERQTDTILGTSGVEQIAALTNLGLPTDYQENFDDSPLHSEGENDEAALTTRSNQPQSVADSTTGDNSEADDRTAEGNLGAVVGTGNENNNQGSNGRFTIIRNFINPNYPQHATPEGHYAIRPGTRSGIDASHANSDAILGAKRKEEEFKDGAPASEAGRKSDAEEDNHKTDVPTDKKKQTELNWDDVDQAITSLEDVVDDVVGAGLATTQTRKDADEDSDEEDYETLESFNAIDSGQHIRAGNNNAPVNTNAPNVSVGAEDERRKESDAEDNSEPDNSTAQDNRGTDDGTGEGNLGADDRTAENRSGGEEEPQNDNNLPPNLGADDGTAEGNPEAVVGTGEDNRASHSGGQEEDPPPPYALFEPRDNGEEEEAQNGSNLPPNLGADDRTAEEAAGEEEEEPNDNNLHPNLGAGTAEEEARLDEEIARINEQLAVLGNRPPVVPEVHGAGGDGVPEVHGAGGAGEPGEGGEDGAPAPEAAHVDPVPEVEAPGELLAIDKRGFRYLELIRNNINEKIYENLISAAETQIGNEADDIAPVGPISNLERIQQRLKSAKDDLKEFQKYRKSPNCENKDQYPDPKKLIEDIEALLRRYENGIAHLKNKDKIFSKKVISIGSSAESEVIKKSFTDTSVLSLEEANQLVKSYVADLKRNYPANTATSEHTTLTTAPFSMESGERIKPTVKTIESNAKIIITQAHKTVTKSIESPSYARVQVYAPPQKIDDIRKALNYPTKGLFGPKIPNLTIFEEHVYPSMVRMTSISGNISGPMRFKQGGFPNNFVLAHMIYYQFKTGKKFVLPSSLKIGSKMDPDVCLIPEGYTGKLPTEAQVQLFAQQWYSLHREDVGHPDYSPLDKQVQATETLKPKPAVPGAGANNAGGGQGAAPANPEQNQNAQPPQPPEQDLGAAAANNAGGVQGEAAVNPEQNQNAQPPQPLGAAAADNAGAGQGAAAANNEGGQEGQPEQEQPPPAPPPPRLG